MFNHTAGKCQSEQLCITCGLQHIGSCTAALKCVNCGKSHRSDYLQCPSCAKEAEFLQFKCRNFLSFVGAHQKLSQKSNPRSYDWVSSVKKSDYEEIQKMIESRTNNMLKILEDYSSKQSENFLETISTLIMN